jgi:pimeloyl-ACP methyl ester carboxylesterase
MEFVEVDGVRLEIKRVGGDKPPILMLHEGLGSVSMWRDFPERLAAATGHEVICWSRRGYGWSDPSSGPFEPDYMHREAALVPDLMRALNLRSAHFFGHSDGGSIALLAASRFPDLVSSLILEAPHVFVEDLTIESIRKVRDLFEPSGLGQKLGRHHARPNDTFWLWNDIWLDDRFRRWNIEDHLSQIAVPTLVIQGLDDEYGTLEQIDRMQAYMPQIQRLVLDRCGHSPHRDQASQVLSGSSRFLEAVGPE